MSAPRIAANSILRAAKALERANKDLDRRQKQLNKVGIRAIQGSAKKRTFPSRFRNIQDNNLPSRPPRKRRVRSVNPFRVRFNSDKAILVLKTYFVALRNSRSGQLNELVIRHFNTRELIRDKLRIRKREVGDRIVGGRIVRARREGVVSRSQPIAGNLIPWSNRSDRGLQVFRHVLRAPVSLRKELTLDPSIKEQQPFLERVAAEALKKSFRDQS